MNMPKKGGAGVILFLIIVGDSPIIIRPVDYHAFFGKSSLMTLEQSETGKRGMNLMNCGDYSGCTLVRIADETSGEPGEGRKLSTLRASGIAWAMLYVRKRVSASVLKL